MRFFLVIITHPPNQPISTHTFNASSDTFATKQNTSPPFISPPINLIGALGQFNASPVAKSSRSTMAIMDHVGAIIPNVLDRLFLAHSFFAACIFFLGNDVWLGAARRNYHRESEQRCPPNNAVDRRDALLACCWCQSPAARTDEPQKLTCGESFAPRWRTRENIIASRPVAQSTTAAPKKADPLISGTAHSCGSVVARLKLGAPGGVPHQTIFFFQLPKRPP
jgi:hypothetical protein